MNPLPNRISYQNAMALDQPGDTDDHSADPFSEPRTAIDAPIFQVSTIFSRPVHGGLFRDRDCIPRKRYNAI
jgi:hypothetical protein